MRMKAPVFWVLVALALSLTLAAVAKTGTNDKDKDAPVSASAATTAAPSHAQDDPLRVEGEKSFHANCGRCHAAPPKFSPRMTATIIRHMRVRATITEQEMRSILHYMTQ